jgi:hypothetical protein
LNNQIIVGAGLAKDYKQYYNLTSKPALTGLISRSALIFVVGASQKPEGRRQKAEGNRVLVS